MRPRHARRAIDSIVATVLVVAVTLVASVAVSGFVFGAFARSQDSAQIAVTGIALPADDFTAEGTSTNFSCASSSSEAYLTLTNTGTGSSSVASISITWAGSNTAYTVQGACDIGPSGSATANQNVIFAATTQMSPSATAGQAYSGTVTLSSGAQLLFTGSWQ